jgi:hypothetical protein
MKRRAALLGLAAPLAGLLLWFWARTDEPREPAGGGGVTPSGVATAPPVRPGHRPDPADAPAAASSPAAAARADESAAPSPRGSRDVETLKQEIYARRIDRVDRLHLLDDLVQTGDRDPRELWDAAWGGVDDWKRSANGFRLEQVDGDTHMFIPDAATMRTYTFFESIQPFVYDETTGEFVNTVDYYGKPIYNVLKFLDEDVAVMMTISGAKVDLQIYEKGAPRAPDRPARSGREALPRLR